MAERSISFYDGQDAIFKNGYISGRAARFREPDGSGELRLNSSSLTIVEDDDSVLGKDQVVIVGGDNPWIKITDEEGFKAALGHTGTVNTRTGRTNETSAASLILFGKDGTAIWIAP